MLGIRARKFLHRAIKTPAFARFVGAIKVLPDPQDLNQGDLKRGRSPAGEFKPAADLPCHHDPGYSEIYRKYSAYSDGRVGKAPRFRCFWFFV